MRARGDASARAILNTIELDTVFDPADPRLLDVSNLLDRTFADPNTVLGVDRMREFLAANSRARRTFRVLLAQTEDRSVVGCSVFSYVPRSNCGFSEYLVVDRELRGTRLGRRLFDRRKELLDAEASESGFGTCRGLFIEVDSPERTPPALAEAERETSLDVRERLRVFDHLGFLRVDVPYVQPSLAPDKKAIDYLDLLFAPWHETTSGAIPVEWVFETIEPVWSAWTPLTYARHLSDLRRQALGPKVALTRLQTE